MFDLQGYGNLLLQGTLITIKLGTVSLLLGLVFGLVGAGMKSSRFWLIRQLATIYTNLVRGIPELLFVLFVYFGGSLFLQMFLKSIGYNKYIEVSAFWAGVAALSVMFGAYATEVFIMALKQIPKGQTEAAQSVGMNKWQTFFRIILPQLWLIALPALGNLALVLLKDTALISVVGLKDLMFFATRAAQSTQLPFTFYMAAAMIYLGLTIIITGAIAGAETLANPAKRYANSLKKSKGNNS